jgi:hypothetical protein
MTPLVVARSASDVAIHEVRGHGLPRFARRDGNKSWAAAACDLAETKTKFAEAKVSLTETRIVLAQTKESP